jgi:hypothetical protein
LKVSNRIILIHRFVKFGKLLRFRWKYKREKIRAVIREALKEDKLSKNRCIAAVHEIKKMKYGHASSYDTIADELQDDIAEGVVLVASDGSVLDAGHELGAGPEVIDLACITRHLCGVKRCRR